MHLSTYSYPHQYCNQPILSYRHALPEQSHLKWNRTRYPNECTIYRAKPRVGRIELWLCERDIVNSLAPDWPSCTTRGTTCNKEPMNDRRSLHQAAPSHSTNTPWHGRSFFLFAFSFVVPLRPWPSVTKVRRFFKSLILRLKLQVVGKYFSSTSSFTYNPVHETPYISQSIDHTQGTLDRN